MFGIFEIVRCGVVTSSVLQQPLTVRFNVPEVCRNRGEIGFPVSVAVDHTMTALKWQHCYNADKDWAEKYGKAVESVWLEQFPLIPKKISGESVALLCSTEGCIYREP
jgi:hypothetical protein